MKITETLTDEAVLSEIGRRIATARIHAGKTQSQMAAAAGIAKRTLERMENGEQAQFSSLVRVLRELGNLPSLDSLLPDSEVGPLDILRRQGQPRRRVGRSSETGEKGAGSFSWGDEK